MKNKKKKKKKIIIKSNKGNGRKRTKIM